MKRDMAFWIATWGGAGLAPKAPGSWGSLAALVSAYPIIILTGSPFTILVGALLLYPVGVWASHRYALSSRHKDPSEIVVDEVAGQWIVLGLVPPTLYSWLAAFLLFRFFDILKPWPIKYADRNITGGFGIMLDDVLAALYAVLAAQALFFFFPG